MLGADQYPVLPSADKFPPDPPSCPVETRLTSPQSFRYGFPFRCGISVDFRAGLINNY